MPAESSPSASIRPVPGFLPHSCRIGGLEIAPALVLAPLADFSHAAFRELVAGLGGCGLFVTEMLNSRIVASQPLERDPYMAAGPCARPLVGQLVGGDPAVMARAAGRLAGWGVDGIDINMGCSRQRIVRMGWGLGLMADERRALAVVQAVRRTVPDSLPLTVKLRSFAGHDEGRLLAFARRLVDAGVAGICLHPRSGADGFKRPARWQEIGLLAAELPVPVIGNGDVFSVADARRLVHSTGCAAVMLGRGALIRPWLFAEIATGRPWQGSPAALLHRYAGLVERYLPPELRLRRFDQFCNWFFRNWLFHRQLFAGIRRQPDLAGRLALFDAYLARHGDTRVQRPFAGRL